MLAIGGKGVMPWLGDLSDKPIGKNEIEEALQDLKVGKSPDLHGIAPELLECGVGVEVGGGELVILWLEMVVGVRFEKIVAPTDFSYMCLEPEYKGK